MQRPPHSHPQRDGHNLPIVFKHVNYSGELYYIVMLINKKLRLTFMQIAINSVLLGDKLFALIFVRIDFMLGCECHY